MREREQTGSSRAAISPPALPNMKSLVITVKF